MKEDSYVYYHFQQSIAIPERKSKIYVLRLELGLSGRSWFCRKDRANWTHRFVDHFVFVEEKDYSEIVGPIYIKQGIFVIALEGNSLTNNISISVRAPSNRRMYY